MTEKQMKLVIGSLLHDIGKIAYRSGNGRNHSQSGHDYLKDEIGINDPDILHCIRFHHGANLTHASLKTDDNAYLSYFADNIAASADRRESPDGENGFDRQAPLASIFNILNGNQEDLHFARQVLDGDRGINYPTSEPIAMDEHFYKEIIANITDSLKGLSFTEGYLNSLLSVLEANLSYIPSSTSKRELADISLYDHAKITAAAAQCVEQYLYQEGIADYREKLFTHAASSYGEKMFLLYSMDISGIQNFIYTTASEGALKNLRARSFYLEIMMEHIIDELLSALSLSRANLLYAGGGHCYLLLPNTDAARATLDKKERDTNAWFMEEFGTALYVAGGYAPCSADNLKNKPKGSYAELYRTISRAISVKKLHRYTAKEIRALNSRSHAGKRECKVCHKISSVDQDGRCRVCAAFQRLSDGIVSKNFFTVTRHSEKDTLPLPGGMFLRADTRTRLTLRMKEDSYVRAYTKNKMYAGNYVETKLWVGNYSSGDTFKEFAKNAEGSERIGVLRADVDSLGKTFVQGFQRADGDERCVTISRTAALSRQLSLFFKCHINQILRNGQSHYLGKSSARRAAIVYSGGDDIFLVGAWNDVIEAFIDIRTAFRKFTQNTLSISGGIGIYQPGYPINIIAKKAALLEDLSKSQDGKNAITLFDSEGSYPWDTFCSKVLDEKFCEIRRFFELTKGEGTALLYHTLELLRTGKGERFNRARYVYLLSQMEPEPGKPKEEAEAYRQFSRKMYQWAGTAEGRQETVTAIYLYLYLTKEKETRDETNRR